MLVRIEERCDMFLARRSTACRARLAAWDVLAKNGTPARVGLKKDAQVSSHRGPLSISSLGIAGSAHAGVVSIHSADCRRAADRVLCPRNC